MQYKNTDDLYLLDYYPMTRENTVRFLADQRWKEILRAKLTNSERKD